MSLPHIQPTLIPVGIIWACEIVCTQPVGAPASMGCNLNIPEGERGMVLGGLIGPDNYAAGRQIDAYFRPVGTARDYYNLGGDSVDNQIIHLFPILTSITETAMTVAVLGVPYMPFILPENSRLAFRGANLANTETLSVLVWIATRLEPPTSEAVGTGVTLSTDSITQV